MSGFGYTDRFTDTLSGGPQFTPLYSNQNTKPILESENKEIKAQQDELLEALETIIERWDTPLWKDVPHTAECINAARLIVAKAKGM